MNNEYMTQGEAIGCCHAVCSTVLFNCLMFGGKKTRITFAPVSAIL